MRRLKLHHWILIAMGLGAAIGLPLNLAAASGDVDAELVRTIAGYGKEVGGLFLRALQMLVVPLIVSSLIGGVTGMGDLRKLGTLGARTVAFYLSTSFLAIVTGIAFVNLLSPGVGVDLGLLEANAEGHTVATVADEGRSLGTVLWTQLTSMIPKNPLRAAAEGDMLPIIFFSLLLGVFISLVEHGGDETEEGYRESAAPKQERPVVVLRQFWQGLFEVMMKMTLAVIQLAPIGVFGFMLYAAAGKGFEAFEALGKYALAVAAALSVHAFVTLPVIYRFLTKRSPLNHARAMTPALLTAFSTASSNGTLPLTMQCVEKSGVPNRVGSFVLPLGATINMDGTALYEAVAVLFIAQVYGMDLSLGQQAVVALTALLASIGAAGIPHAGTVMMVVVLSAVGLPTTAVGLILAVDRILDMCRTTVNVWSDSIAAAVVAGSVEESAEA
ncbi:MAG: dicarboxylate/amino acid:cation symporter [Myxococcota bacterium]